MRLIRRYARARIVGSESLESNSGSVSMLEELKSKTVGYDGQRTCGEIESQPNGRSTSWPQRIRFRTSRLGLPSDSILLLSSNGLRRKRCRQCPGVHLLPYVLTASGCQISHSRLEFFVS